MGLYNRLLQRCELNPHTTEAAAGALQNVTAGDRRVRTRAWPCTGDRRGEQGGHRRSLGVYPAGAGWRDERKYAGEPKHQREGHLRGSEDARPHPDRTGPRGPWDLSSMLALRRGLSRGGANPGHTW